MAAGPAVHMRWGPVRVGTGPLHKRLAEGTGCEVELRDKDRLLGVGHIVW
jgi:hypothetical protein